MTERPEPIRVAWLMNAPGPNTSDFFDAVAAVPGCELEVFYCAADHPKWHGSFSLSDGHRHRTLWNANPAPHRAGMLHLNPGVVAAFRDPAYDIAVIAGCAYPTAALAMAARRMAKLPYAVWAEMVNRSGSSLRRAAQARTLHALVRRADTVFTMGERGRDSVREIGVPPERIRELPYCCNLAPYLDVPRDARSGRVRRRRVLTLSRLIRRKRVDLVVEAFVKLAPEFPDWDLRVGGSGPLLGELKRMVPADLKHRIEFAGFVEKADQPRFYGSGDVFALASEQDGWGMVVPEAMASGLPVVASRAVQSAVEMLAAGGGSLVAPGDASSIREALRRLLADGSRREAQAAQARAVVQRYSPAPVAAQAVDDLRAVLHRARQRDGAGAGRSA